MSGSTVVIFVYLCPPHFPIWTSKGLEGHSLSLYSSLIGVRQDTPSFTMTITTPLKEAWNDAIYSGKFIDTQIILFSRRDTSARVCKPKALYANSHVLKSVPYFNNREFSPYPTSCACNDCSPGVLSGPFSESEIKGFSETVDDGEYAEDYGYSSDSDLEEDCDFESPVPPANLKRPQPRALYGEYQENARTGNVIKIQDVAFIT